MNEFPNVSGFDSSALFWPFTIEGLQPGHEIRTATPTVAEATGLRSKKAQESRRALDTWRKRGVTEERTVKGIHSHLSSFKLNHLTQSGFICIWVKTREAHAALCFLTYWTLRRDRNLSGIPALLPAVQPWHLETWIHIICKWASLPLLWVLLLPVFWRPQCNTAAMPGHQDYRNQSYAYI